MNYGKLKIHWREITVWHFFVCFVSAAPVSSRIRFDLNWTIIDIEWKNLSKSVVMQLETVTARCLALKKRKQSNTTKTIDNQGFLSFETLVRGIRIVVPSHIDWMTPRTGRCKHQTRTRSSGDTEPAICFRSSSWKTRDGRHSLRLLLHCEVAGCRLWIGRRDALRNN